MPRSEFERGYRTALRHVIAMQHQAWPDEALPSIRKFVAQVKNCCRKEAAKAKDREDSFLELMGKLKAKQERKKQ